MRTPLQRWIYATLALLLCLGIVSRAEARNGPPPQSRRGQGKPIAEVAQRAVPAIDVQEKLREDKQGPPTPLRFAIGQPVQITPETGGTWENVAGGRLWRLRIHSPGATDLNFAFTTFWLPEGATLHINSIEEDYYQGPYTAQDNKADGQLWTPAIPGGSAWLELFVPADAKGQPRLVLGQVNSGYRDMFGRRKDANAIAAAGVCENDVVCTQAAPWTNEVRSVARYTIGGTNTCTGTLITDVAGGGQKHFFLSANHCMPSVAPAPSSIVVYWNYQSPSCGLRSGGSLSQNQVGAIFRAAHVEADFALLELEDAPDSTYKVFYSGWDRSGVAPSSVVGIHHPQGEEKAISYSSNAPVSVVSCITTNPTPVPNTHWQVVWNSGVTERGSSGSGIWSPASHRLIGTLSGGFSDCTTPNGADCYGKFSVAWSIGTNAGSRLRDWLDPQNTGVTSVSGFDPNARFTPMIAGYTITSETCSNNAVDPGETVTLQLAIQNVGIVSGTNVVVTLLATNGVTFVSGSQTYGTLAGGATLSKPFTFTAVGNCGQLLVPTLKLQTSSTNYLVTFNLNLGRTNVVLAENFDNVVTPALPVGWAAGASGTTNVWKTVTAQSDSLPNSIFAADQASVVDNQLTSPAFTFKTANAYLKFRHNYITEDYWDGGVLEISVNGGAFTNIANAGGTFIANGYEKTLLTSPNPLDTVPAWTGNSGGFVETVVQLPATAAGKPTRLRWRFGSDDSNGSLGWYVDSVQVSDGFTCCIPLLAPNILNPRRVGSQLAFSYNTLAGQTYIVESSSALGANQSWTAVSTNPGTGTQQSFTNNVPGPQRFFRLRTQ